MMLGKRRRKLKSRTKDNRRATAEVKTDNLELQTWANLPAELLELFLSRLNIGDNIRASAVCKRWKSVASSVRVVDLSPRLMYFPEKGHRYDFYDPVQRNTYSLELPELDGCHVCYTKDGWLLLYRWQGVLAVNDPFFLLFNPFTRERIKLPILEETCHIAAFSCAPTSAKCVIFTINRVSPTVVAVNRCYPGANEWTTVNYQSCSHFSCSLWTNIVFSNGFFYCLSQTGWLGVFDTVECNWSVLEVPPPKCLESYIAKKGWKLKFMVEHEGNIFVIHIHCQDPIIFKLDQTLMEWKRVRTLDGVTIFASFLSSHSRTYVTEIMRNSVYFPKVRLYGQRCISFSLDDHRYYPTKRCSDWVESGAFGNIWIEPPKDFAGWI